MGGCYHVMGRGLERRRIFASTEDKQDFVARPSAKSVICYLGMKELGLSSMGIASRLKMGQSAVSMSSKRGHSYCNEHCLSIDSF